METNSRINIKIIYPDVKKTIVATFKFLIKNLFTREYKGLRYTKIDGFWEELYLDKEILEKIKELKGIYYTETETDKLLFIRPQKLDNKEIEGIFYWTEFYGRWDLTIRIFGFLKRCSYERRKFLKKGTIEGRGVFHGFISPRFWLKWETLYHVIDKKKAIEAKFSDELLFIRSGIDLFIQSSFSNYIFEIGKTGSSSLIYEPPSSLSVSQGTPFYPKYSTIFEILEEIRNKIIAPYFNTTYGVELRTLVPVEFGPIDEPSLGLWESDKKEENKLKEELFNKVLLKTKESQIPPKENSAELLNEEISIKPQKSQQLLELVKLEKPKIDFYDSEIPKIIPPEVEEKVITKKREASPQIFSLLRHYLEHHYQQKKGIHWMQGFVIFSAWRKKEKEEKIDYLQAFSRCHSFLKKLGNDTRLWRIEERKGGKGDRCKEGHWILKDVSFSSNIFDAQELYEKAKKLKEASNFSEARKMLIEACKTYPDCLEGNLLLLECCKEAEFKNVENEEIKKMLSFFEKKKTEYRDAYDAIADLRGRREEDYWKDPEAEEIKKMRDKLESAETILSRWGEAHKIFTPEEEKWEKMKNLIRAVVDNENNDKFDELATHDDIREVMKKVKYMILKEFYDFEEEKIERRVLNCFYIEIRKISIVNFLTPKAFNAYLRKTLYYAVRNEIIEEKGLRNKTLPLLDDYSEEYPSC